MRRYVANTLLAYQTPDHSASRSAAARSPTTLAAVRRLFPTPVSVPELIFDQVARGDLFCCPRAGNSINRDRFGQTGSTGAAVLGIKTIGGFSGKYILRSVGAHDLFNSGQHPRPDTPAKPGDAEIRPLSMMVMPSKSRVNLLAAATVAERQAQQRKKAAKPPIRSSPNFTRR